MAVHSVNDLLLLNHQQVLIHETIRECLIKAEAVARMALNENFFDCGPSVIHAYLWTLSDLVSEAKSLQEGALNELIKNSKRNWFS
jgi:hypothetical protein